MDDMNPVTEAGCGDPAAGEVIALLSRSCKYEY